MGLLVYAVAGVAVLGLAQRSRMGGRVPRGSITGRAAVAAGDSGVFASPVLPYGVRTGIPHADAESAAVAMGYWDVPSMQDLTTPYYTQRPLERRHFCGRSYYVRPVVLMPDTTVVRSHSGNDWGMWAPTWVMPICDDAERVRTSVQLSDVPAGLRVIQGDGPGDVPELVPAPRTFPHIGFWNWRHFPDWERGIGMSPETAVAVAAAWLGHSAARVTEVPEAFTIVLPPEESKRLTYSRQTFAVDPTCPRWRLTLDRPVTLRGTPSGQVIRTRTLYVSRGERGCVGVPVLQIPTPAQPTTVPLMYGVPREPPRGSVLPTAKDHPGTTLDLEFLWTTLQVTEPIWFEAAQLVHERG